jgi:uncharacterized protein (DUF58 family)
MPCAERWPTTPWPTGFGALQQGSPLRLGLRNLYILPTGFGGLWLAGATLLLLVAIQTQRNGPLLLGFLMLGLLLLALLLTHFNLQGLELRCGTPPPGFADEPLLYPLLLRSAFPRQAIGLRISGDPGSDEPEVRPVLTAGTTRLDLPWGCPQRGRQRPGTLVIRSTAPLGLFVCWSRWTPPVTQTIYPARIAGPVAQAMGEPGQQQQAQPQQPWPEGQEDWHDLRPHRPEDNPSRLAWTVLARGRGQLSKVFSDAATRAPWLQPAAGISRERALCHLSAEIWRRSRSGEAYGLRLGALQIPPGQGRAHRDRCLLALACHG